MKHPSRAKPTDGVAEMPPVSGVVLAGNEFDFMEGAFLRAQRTRHVMLALSLVTASALTYLVITGLSAAQESENNRAAIDAANLHIAESSATLARVDSAGGFPSEVLRNHISTRQGAYRQVVADEYDVSMLLRAVTSAAPAGVAVQTADIKPVPVSTPATASPSASPSVSAPAGPPPTPTLDTSALAPDVTLLSEFAAGIARIPGVGKMAGANDLSGGAHAWTLTLSSPLGPAALTSRARAVATPPRTGG